MHLHEYQAKTVLASYHIPSPPFFVARSVEQAAQALEDHPSFDPAVVKIQVHAGGRGQAGGVIKAQGRAQILQTVEKLLDLQLVNQQTGPAGIRAQCVLVTPLVDIEQEFYLALTIDRKRRCPVLICSSQGGVEIEQTAQDSPEKILTLHIYPHHRLLNFQKIQMQQHLAIPDPAALFALCQNLLDAFKQTDAELIEINPLVWTKQHTLVALDAKMTLDDNALFRQKTLQQHQDLTQLKLQEQLAKQHDLAYIGLEGNIGCMVNGAGLAMATMDMIQHYGAEPANFLDVGGGASKEKIAAAFTILLNDPQVQAILVNIFGGIMNCHTLASALVETLDQSPTHTPIIMRLEGTRVDEGKALMHRSRHQNLFMADSLEQACQEAVAKGACK